VDEVERFAVGDSGEQRVTGVTDIVPAHVGERLGIERLHGAFDQSEAWLAVLIRAIEQQLEPDTDSQEGALPGAECLIETRG
jgi:hypothetical protein